MLCSLMGSERVEDKEAELALDVLRSLAAEEEARAERGVTRARQAFALAAGFFAVVQTVSFSSFAQKLIVAGERRHLLYLAGASGVMLTVCGLLLLVTDRAFRSRAISTDSILEVVNDTRQTSGPAYDGFISLYARLVDELRDTNARRYLVVFVTQVFALLSLLAVLVELVYSLHSRLGK